jgi:hypothetical protein
MNPRFKKLALAASISAGLGVAALPANAMLVSEAGEALLIPLVTHDGGNLDAGKANTYIKVTIPETVGFDTVPNVFTAPNTTPTNGTGEPGPSLFPRDNGAGKSIHWYWFDSRSVHRLNGEIPVTPGDVVWIDWEKASRGTRAGELGYMVIGTETARDGSAADFAMFGDAWYELYSPEPFMPYGSMVPIPVLPMIDGADGDATFPSVSDNVLYSPSGIPSAVSPLYSGMRTNASDGSRNDVTVFNMSLGDRNFRSVHVVWLDQNTGSNGINVDVFDSEENVCSDSADLPIELNYIVIDNWAGSTGAGRDFCIPSETDYTTDVQNFGYVTYYLPEYVDRGTGLPESAGVAFSITMDFDSEDNLRFTSEAAQVRGTYK